MPETFALSLSDPHIFTFRAGNSMWFSTMAGEILSALDLASAQSFAGQTERQRLEQALMRQSLFVGSLANLAGKIDEQNGNTAIDLRFVYLPAGEIDDQQHLRFFIEMRVAGNSAEISKKLLLEKWKGLVSLFPHDLYRFKEVCDQETFFLCHQNEFDIDSTYVAEVRKRETITSPYHLGFARHYYTPHQLKQSAHRSYAPLLETLIQQHSPYTISICVVPTTLLDEEREAIDYITSFLQKMAQGFTEPGQTRTRTYSPDAGAAECLAHYQKILRYPTKLFHLKIQVISSEPISQSVIGALAQEISDDYEVIAPSSPDDLENARRSFIFMLPELSLWGRKYLPWYINRQEIDLPRLSLLVDPTEAALAFRLPIPGTDGNRGLPTHRDVFQPTTISQTDYENGILLGQQVYRGFPSEKIISVAQDDFTRHALIAGTTGSGKTTTCLSILHQISESSSVPFLVIWPAASRGDEYRNLIDIPEFASNFRLFAIGGNGENISPFRLNPFEIPPNVNVGTHIDGLLGCFEAAFDFSTESPLPYIFRICLTNVYRSKGWTDLISNEGQPFSMPTFSEFLEEIIWHMNNKLEHKGEVRGNIIGAAKLRLEALQNSSLGRVIGGENSTPVHEWLDYPTVIELTLAKEQEISLMMGFLLLNLYEYCVANRSVNAGLQHITLIEEAHRLLKNPHSASANRSSSLEQTVGFFEQILKEIRKYGEGMIFAEQSPTELATGVVRDTNLKIIHRLTTEQERHAIGETMRLNDEQKRELGALVSGQAVVFYEGLSQPVLVQVPNFKQEKDIAGNPPSDKRISDFMQEFHQTYSELYKIPLPFEECNLCKSQCRFREKSDMLRYNRKLCGALKLIYDQRDTKDPKATLHRILSACAQSAATVGIPQEETGHAAYCVFLHMRQEVKELKTIPARIIHPFLRTEK